MTDSRGSGPQDMVSRRRFDAAIARQRRALAPRKLDDREARPKGEWSGRPGSSWRRSAWKADALPTELRPHTTIRPLHKIQAQGYARSVRSSTHFPLERKRALARRSG